MSVTQVQADQVFTDNELSDEGAARLADALKINTGITKLSLFSEYLDC